MSQCHRYAERGNVMLLVMSILPDHPTVPMDVWASPQLVDFDNNIIDKFAYQFSKETRKARKSYLNSPEVIELNERVLLLQQQLNSKDRQLDRFVDALQSKGINISKDDVQEIDTVIRQADLDTQNTVLAAEQNLETKESENVVLLEVLSKPTNDAKANAAKPIQRELRRKKATKKGKKGEAGEQHIDEGGSD